MSKGLDKPEPVEFVAHIRKKDGCRESVPAHLLAVRRHAERLGDKIGAKHIAGLLGVLHDLGKNTVEFFEYLEQAVANPDKPPRRGSVDHSTAGGKWVYEQFHLRAKQSIDRLLAEWIANCIVSHHGGLKDFVGPEGRSPFLDRVRMTEDKLPEFELAVQRFLSTTMTKEEIDAYFAKAREELRKLLEKMKACSSAPRAMASLTLKYLFSCLIDADRTETRLFDEDEQPEDAPDTDAFFARTYQSLLAKLESFEQDPNAGRPINRLRSEMSLQCETFATERPSGVYTLSIPTGGGKTLASLRYALRHAMDQGKERIIYILPYNTIIEQNASEVRKIVQDDDMLLEHHSNVADDRDLRRLLDPDGAANEEEEEEEDQAYNLERQKLRLARDTWDRPILFTTMVQFLNTFYASGSRHVRRLHQLSNAVIIFDEVQAVPPHCISMFNEAVNFLHGIGGSTVVLCTATQPALQYVRQHVRLAGEPEIIREPDRVMKQFKRVELRDETGRGALSTERLAAFVAERMADIDSLLVILNTKKAVRDLFEYLREQAWVAEGEVKLYHLSTLMCGAHRKARLDEIRALLGKERIICVSTQLIEAGVDISFQGVIRSLAGLDSIAQAAGRCNRNGETGEPREVSIIRSAVESLSSLPEIKLAAEQTERVLGEFKSNPERYGHHLLSREAMALYFFYYYETIKEKMDYPVPKEGLKLFLLLDKNKLSCDRYINKHQAKPPLEAFGAIATVEEHFEVIANAGKSVIVPYNDDAQSIITALNGEAGPSKLGDLLRQAQPYTVNLFDKELRQLDKGQNLRYLLQGRVLALNETAYDKEYGVNPKGDGEWGMAMA